MEGINILLKSQILILQHGLIDYFLRKGMPNSNRFGDCTGIVIFFFFFLKHFIMERELGSCSPVISTQALAAILLDNKRLFTFYTFLKLFPAFYKPGMM